MMPTTQWRAILGCALAVMGAGTVAWILADRRGVDRENASLPIVFRTTDDTEKREAQLSMAGGVAPPGTRDLAGAAAWTGVPKPLSAAIVRLETAERLRVRYSAINRAAVDVLVTLTQVGQSYELITVAANDPTGPTNIVTVVDGVAYIEDVGQRFDRARQRFRINLHENFDPNVSGRWWDMSWINDASIEWIANRGPEPSEMTFVASREGEDTRRSFVVTADGWLRTSSRRWGSTTIEQVKDAVTVGVPEWAAGHEDPLPTTWRQALADDPTLVKLLDRVVQVDHQPLSSGDDAGPLESQCGSPPYTPSRRLAGVAPLPEGTLFRCQINLADLPARSGLPTTGLLQFYLNDFEGFARYVARPVIADHDPAAAAALLEEDWTDSGSTDGRWFESARLRFTEGYTSSDDAILASGPRRWRYTREYLPSPNVELEDALAPLGIRFMENDVDMMGGRWLANGRTPDGFVRLLMVGDDVGYSYWHIPEQDLAVGRFDRVEGGWTD